MLQSERTNIRIHLFVAGMLGILTGVWVTCNPGFGLDMSAMHFLGGTILAAIAILVGALFWKLLRCFSNPFTLCCFCWFFPFGLSQAILKFLPICRPVSSLTWFVVVSSGVVFLMFASIAFYAPLGRDKVSYSAILSGMFDDQLYTPLIRLSFAVGTISLAVSLVEFSVLGKVPIFTKDVGIYRRYVALPYLHSLLSLNRLAAFLAFTAHFSRPSVYLPKILIGILGFAELASGSRIGVLMIAGLLWVTRSTFRRLGLKKELKGMLSLGLLLFAVFSLMTVLRSPKETLASLFSYIGLPDMPYYKMVAITPLLYVVPNFSNLDVLLHTPIRFTYGLRVLAPLWALTLMKNFINAEGGFSFGVTMNIVPYLSTFYEDFGLSGVIVLPALLGFMSGLAFRKVLTQNSLLWRFIYALLGLQAMAMPFLNIFSSTSTWVTLLIALPILVTIDKRQVRYQVIGSTRGTVCAIHLAGENSPSGSYK